MTSLSVYFCSTQIPKKFAHDGQADERKGVGQLAHAAKQLFGPDAQTSLPGVDLKGIKKLYLYIITLDTIGGTVGISTFLDTFLQEQLQANDLTALQVRPLYCSDIAALEAAAAYFGTQSLPDILERWFAENPSLTAPLPMIDIGGDNWQGNEWLAQDGTQSLGEWLRSFFRTRTLTPLSPKPSGGQAPLCRHERAVAAA
jgi:hypothetical protein